MAERTDTEGNGTMGANTMHVTDETFESEVLSSDVPVLVDFWAEWCGPCKALGPTIDEIADDFAGRAKVAKVDIDKAQELAMKYRIQSIPTVAIFKGGEVIDMRVGLSSKEDLSDRLEKAVG
ncbi:MAG: thioredoxin [Planctomycetota bacterium]